MPGLFDPIQIGSVTVQNRLIRSATNDYMGKPDGWLSEAETRMYEELAKNNVGLIITGHAYVQHPQARVREIQNGIYSDQFIPGYREVTGLVHSHDSKILLQISHAGGQTRPEFIEGMMPVSPSGVPLPQTPDSPGRPFAEPELAELVSAFADAAERAHRAGFDGVQVHCAHEYLLSQFLSPTYNRREDRWGGALENRIRLPLEILRAVRGRVPRDFLVAVKINTNDRGENSGWESELVEALKMMEREGADLVELSGFDWAVNKAKQPFYPDAARQVKAALQIPVALVGGIDLRAAEPLLGDCCDMISLARPLICEPDYITRYLADSSAPMRCVRCSQCLQSYFKSGKRCVLHTA